MSEPDTLTVYVYRGARKEECYLYVRAEDAFEDVPDELLAAMGELALVMTLELHAGRPLARENAESVMRNVRARGYHLQLPPVDTPGSRRLQ